MYRIYESTNRRIESTNRRIGESANLRIESTNLRIKTIRSFAHSLIRLFAYSLIPIICLLLTGCGFFGTRETVELDLEDGKITIGYEPLAMGETDPIANTRPGSLAKIDVERVMTFTTDADLLFDTVILRKGTYSLWLHRGLTWWLIINKSLPEDLKYDETTDAAHIPFNHTTHEEPIDHLTITLSGEGKKGRLEMHWGVHQFYTRFYTLTSR